MAKKKKKNRRLVGLQCEETGMRIYITERNIVNTTEPIKIKKYNPQLRKHTLFKEVKKLK